MFCYMFYTEKETFSVKFSFWLEKMAAKAIVMLLRHAYKNYDK